MKKKILSLALCAAMSLSSVTVCTSYQEIFAKDYNIVEFVSDNVYFPVDILSTDYYSNEIDYSLWDKFIKYDLCITDYDSLTDKEKELCKFIFETEQSAQGVVRCERARRILAGEDVGERVTLSEIHNGINVENVHGSKIIGNYSYRYSHYGDTTSLYCYRECAPDIIHIDSDINVSEYWLDENGTEKILHEYNSSFKNYNNHYGYFTYDKEAEDYVKNKGLTQNQKFMIYKDEKSICALLSDDSVLLYKPIAGWQKWNADIIKKDKIVYAVLPDETAVVVDNEFKSDDVIDKLVIPEEINGHKVTGIEEKALGYINVSEITLPESIKYLKKLAIWRCKLLKSINIPGGLTYIGNDNFYECESLENLKIDCPELKLTYNSINGNGLKSIDLNVKSIGEGAFAYGSIKNVTLHEGIESIGADAFKGTDIKDIEIPSTVKSIGTGAFSDTGITALEIPASVEVVGALPARQGNMNALNIPIDPPGNPLTNKQELIIDAEGTIFGTSGSEAEKYAKENNIEFVDIDSVRLSKNKMNLIVGEEDNLQVKNYDGEVQWKSEDESIASVENGVVKALGEGTTNILAVIGDKTISCKVAVSTTTVTTTYVTTTTTTTTTTGVSKPSGDADGDGKVSVRDCAYIAKMLANGKGKDIPLIADFNGDGKVDVRDAAAIARYLAKSVK